MGRIDFSFDPEGHVYKLNGEVIPSCSEILREAGAVDYSHVPGAVLDRAADFGTKVHRLLELEDKGILDQATVDPLIAPVLEAWRKFKADQKVEFFQDWIERPTFHGLFRYGVTPDRVGLVDRKPVCIEIKTTSTITNAVALQTVAQKMAYEDITKKAVVKRMAVQLKQDGRYKVYEFKEPGDQFVWIGAVNLWWWKKKNNQLKGGDHENGNG